MYDIQNFRPTNKEILTVVLIVLVFLVGAFGCGYLLGVERTKDIYDNGNGIDAVREQYQHIEVNQRQITDGLAGAVERSDNAAERAERIEERAVRSETAVNDAGVLIDECQQIIGRVRNRGQAHPVKN
jgi:hypothetical protein